QLRARRAIRGAHAIDDSPLPSPVREKRISRSGNSHISSGVSGASDSAGTLRRYQPRPILIRTRLAIQMRFEFLAEFLDDGDGRQRGRIAERTERPAQHILCKIADEHNVAALTHAFMEPGKKFSEPGCTFAARDA